MTTAVSDPLASARRSRAPQDAAVRWLGAHRDSVAMAALLAFAGPVTFLAGALAVLPALKLADAMGLVGWWALYGAALWGALLVTGRAVARVARTRSWLVQAGTSLLAAVAAAAFAAFVARGRLGLLIEQGLVHDTRAADLYAATFSVAMALLYFAHLRRSRDHAVAAARLAIAQVAQRQARRRLVEARLHEVQARIDPELLLELLDMARTLYAQDGARAERFLDDLIAFLRLALPRLKSPSSTLLREADLARAFVALRAASAPASAGLAVDIAPDARHARFPPGILVPLVSPTARAGGRARLTATRSGADCRVVLALSVLPPEDVVVRVRAWLADMLGTRSRLVVDGNDRAQVVLTLPYEPD